jgi:D-alanyl-D-alanine carboxypeptidase (penicillin-binding protein 5/6)
MKHWKKHLGRFLALMLTCAMVCSWASAEILYGPDTAQLDTLEATAAILIDADTGDILYGQNESDKAYPASCTKIMTCLLTIEAIEAGELSLDQIITVDDTHAQGLTADSSTANLATGEEISLENVLYCLMLASANEAANILAVMVSGTISDFVDKMNQRAAELGCTGTHFCNPHGLHNEDHYTTAQDLAIITQEAWKHEFFRTLVGTASYVVPATNLSAERTLYNSNLLLPGRNAEYAYDYAVGGKTGTTNAAGNCLVSVAEKDGRTIIGVVLGAAKITNADGTVVRKVFIESKRLLEYGFSNFQNIELTNDQEIISTIPVTGGEEGATVSVVPLDSVQYGLVSGLTAQDFDRETDLPDTLEAPIAQGQVVGTMTFSYNGEEIATIELVSQTAVPLASEVAAEESQLPDEEANTAAIGLNLNMVLLGALGILALLLIIVLVVVIRHNKRRYRGRRVR